MANHIVRFSAVGKGGVPVTETLLRQATHEERRTTRHQGWAYELARNGVVPEVMPAGAMVDITPPTTSKTGNSVFIETDPADDDSGKPSRAVAHLMPRGAATVSIDLADDGHAAEGGDSQQGKSFVLATEGDTLPVIDKSGAIAELVTVLPDHEIEVLGRLAAFHNEQA